MMRLIVQMWFRIYFISGLPSLKSSYLAKFVFLGFHRVWSSPVYQSKPICFQGGFCTYVSQEVVKYFAERWRVRREKVCVGFVYPNFFFRSAVVEVILCSGAEQGGCVCSPSASPSVGQRLPGVQQVAAQISTKFSTWFLSTSLPDFSVWYLLVTRLKDSNWWNKVSKSPITNYWPFLRFFGRCPCGGNNYQGRLGSQGDHNSQLRSTIVDVCKDPKIHALDAGGKLGTSAMVHTGVENGK